MAYETAYLLVTEVAACVIRRVGAARMKRNDPREPEIRLNGTVYNATYLESRIDSVLPLLVALRDDIRDALRRNTERSGDSLSSGGEQVGKGKGDHADPTFAAAFRRHAEDKVDAVVTGEVEHILEGCNHIVAAFSRNYLLKEVLGADEERVNSVHECLCCEGPAVPRPKTGYCEACYKAWARAGRPEHFGFRRERRAWLASKDRGAQGEAVSG